MGDLCEHLGRLQPGLGRDAPAVEASAAHKILLDQRHAEAEVVRVERGRIPARAASDNRYVVHGSPVFARWPRLARTPGSPRSAITLRWVQTRYLLLASLVTLVAILAASAVWFLMASG